MKQSWKQVLLPLCMALLGGLGYMLRAGLYAAALDEKNLLLRGHPLETALWVSTAGAAVLILLDSRLQKKENALTEQFSPSLVSSLGHIAAAAGILLTVLPQGFLMSPLLKAWRMAGIVSAPLLLWGAFSRALGKTPFFGSYAVVSVFFALYLIGHYQSWCADPQLQNYVFAFLGALFLMVFAYQQAAACTGGGNQILQRMSGLAAFYCCIVTASGTEYLTMYLGCGLWAVTGLSAAETHGKEKAGADDASA